MSKYKIEVTVNIVECDEETDAKPIELEDGRYQYMSLSNTLMIKS